VHGSDLIEGSRSSASGLQSRPPITTPDKPLLNTLQKLTYDRSAWARLIAKVYEVDPLICPRCGSEMDAKAIR
jgi:hypothetical protein